MAIGVEVDVKDVEVLQNVHDYPITPKEHGTEFLMDHRHLWIRSRKQNAILKVRHTVVKAVRDFLHPTRGGDDGHGWPLGRSIFRSELYAIIEGLPGVDHVGELLLRDAQLRLGKTGPGTEVCAYAPPAPQRGLSEATRSELVVRDSRFPQAEPLVEWRDEPFAAIVENEEVELKESFVVTVVDE